MEVRCSNCATEYEFDDALVSARGTSVKCTNCGHQFRVHPTASMSNSTLGKVNETWVVRDARGKETVFRSLRDLQQAIVKGTIDPKHEMSHAGQAFRAMQDIYELQTFFNAARVRPPKPAPRTLLGVGRDGAVTREVEALSEETIRAHMSQRELEGRPSAPPPRKRAGAEPTQDRITPVAGMPAVRLPEATGPTSDVRSQHESGSRPLQQRPSTPVPPQVQNGRAPKAATPHPAAAAAPAAASASPAAELPWQQLQGLRESESAEVAPTGSAGSRWIALVVVVGGLALVAGTVGRSYLSGFVRRDSDLPVVDERVPALLEQARVALARGDFENARAELAKASLLAETDAKVVAAKAQLELAMAEQVWLEQQARAALDAAAALKPARPKNKATELAEAEAAEKVALEKKQLELAFQDRIGKAKSAVASAAQSAPGAIEVVRARVDALRLQNQLKEARGLVGPLSALASDPDNAYSLGALDLAEGASGYPSAIDRLRVAARPEEALGKARALLVYVLALSGDAPAASAELDKLQTLSPRHRALTVLRELVDTAQSRASAETEAAARRTAPVTPRPQSGGSASGEDPQVLLTHAGNLHRQGDLGGAEKVYQSVIARSPNSVTALSGLGDIARQRRAYATAAAFYDQILKQDRNHVPSLMARADLYWHAGNRLLAVALYRRALSQVGPSDAFGQRALRRIEEFDREGAAPSPAPGTESSAGEDESDTTSGEDEKTTAPADEATPPEPSPEPANDETSPPPPTPPPTSKSSTSKSSSVKPPAAAKPAPAPAAEPEPAEPDENQGTEGDKPAAEPEAP